MTDDDAKGLLSAGQPVDAATNSTHQPASETMGTPPSAHGRSWFWGLILIGAIVIAYLPALRGGFIWDDDLYVTGNPLLTAPDGLKRIWFSAHRHAQFCPLVTTTFRFEHMLWGFSAMGYHIVNVLLHCANALLVWVLLRRLALPAAWLGAALFALHPVQVESVAWITELKNTQSTFFYLLAVLSWMKFADGKTAGPWRFYALALLLHAAALLSKTTACTLPAALVLVMWLRHQPIGLRRLLQVAPFLALGLGAGLASVWWETHLGNYMMDVGQSFSALERLLIASRALWFYVMKLIWPVNLTFSYPRWEVSARDPLQYFWLGACIAVVSLLWLRRGTLGRGPVAAVVFFVALLSPLLGFIPVYTFRYSFVADHYQYLACLGLLALAAGGLGTALPPIEKRLPFLKPMLCGMLLLALGVLTWRQCGMYSNLETLWRTTIARNPGSYLAENNLANILFRAGQVDKAIVHYQKSLAILPDYAEANYNLGVALLRKGRREEAMTCFERATADRSGNLKLQAQAHNQLGDLLSLRGYQDEALAHYYEGIQISPGIESLHTSLGNLLLQMGRTAEAKEHFQSAAELQPTNAVTLNNLAWVLATCSDAALRNGHRAVEIAERACQLAGYEQPIFIGTLAAAYAEAGQFEKAVETAQMAKDLASSLGQTNLFEKNQELLERFKQGKAWHQPDK